MNHSTWIFFSEFPYSINHSRFFKWQASGTLMCLTKILLSKSDSMKTYLWNVPHDFIPDPIYSAQLDKPSLVLRWFCPVMCKKCAQKWECAHSRQNLSTLQATILENRTNQGWLGRIQGLFIIPNEVRYRWCSVRFHWKSNRLSGASPIQWERAMDVHAVYEANLTKRHANSSWKTLINCSYI